MSLSPYSHVGQVRLDVAATCSEERFVHATTRAGPPLRCGVRSHLLPISTYKLISSAHGNMIYRSSSIYATQWPSLRPSKHPYLPLTSPYLCSETFLGGVPEAH